jgi:hypothetical protein
MGALPAGFMFSQHSLSTYQRCQRRFWLRYVDRQPWPAPQDAEPAQLERQLARGRTLHLWLARQQVGVDMAPSVAAHPDAELRAWWEAAQRFPWNELPTDYVEAEAPIIVPLGAYRLYARYDLLAVGRDGSAVIVDWKTLQARPSERILRQRWQTRIYLYTALAGQGAVWAAGRPIDPALVRLIYWFTSFPDEPGIIDYSAAAYQRDHQELSALVNEIASKPPADFMLTEDLRTCRGCLYRTLCLRDTSTQPEDDGWLDEEIAFDLELDEPLEPE